MKNIIHQKISWDEKRNKTWLVTRYLDGSVSSEEVTSEQAAEFEAANRF